MTKKKKTKQSGPKGKPVYLTGNWEMDTGALRIRRNPDGTRYIRMVLPAKELKRT